MKLYLSVNNDEINEIINIVSEATDEPEKIKEVITRSHESIWKNDDGSDYMKLSYNYFNIPEDGSRSAVINMDIPDEITLKALKVATKISKVIYSIINLVSDCCGEIESLLKLKKHNNDDYEIIDE